jgi:phage terminase large subunit-like protein
MTSQATIPISTPLDENFTADSFAMRIVSGEMNLLDGFENEALIRAAYEWSVWARPDQLPPTNRDWTTWLVIGGRGAGKTRTGAEWIGAQVRAGCRRLALVGETYEDVREVMICGPSGLLNTGYPEDRPVYESSRHRLVWPCGAEAHAFSADDPDGLRGYQFEAAWSDELCKWRQADATWSNLQLGLRLGDRPRQVVTTTPRPLPLLRQLLSADMSVVTRASTYDNAANLAEAFLGEIARTYEGTRLGRQELLGELIEDELGALWSWKVIEAARGAAPNELDRIVVAIDPPVTSGPDADECGIVVAGRKGHGPEATAYVLADASIGRCRPTEWAERVIAAYRQYGADRIVAEVNQGGELVEQMIRTQDASVPVRTVRATRGKIVRAEPVAALYEQGRVRHVRPLARLEDQMTSYAGQGGPSPDRLDALVWALTDLMLGGEGRPAVHFL